MIFGRNFDYYHHASMVLYTHPSSAYASLSTVDLHYLGFSGETSLDELVHSPNLRSCPFLPFDGMNEKGVAIGMMAVPSAEPPWDLAKASLNCLQIIRLVLDHASTTDGAISLMKMYNYHVEEPPVHFLIADRSGKSAVVEFVHGELKTMYNSEPFHVSTNFIIFGSDAPRATPCWRCDKAYADLKNVNEKIDEQASMEILRTVSQNITMWSVVYNMNFFSLDISVDRKFDKVYEIKVPDVYD